MIINGMVKKLHLLFLVIGYVEDNDSARIVNTSIKGKKAIPSSSRR